MGRMKEMMMAQQEQEMEEMDTWGVYDRMEEEAQKMMEEKRQIEAKTTAWVTVTVPCTEEQLTKYVGEDCDEFENHCSVCQQWARYRKNKTMELLFEVDRLINFALRGE